MAVSRRLMPKTTTCLKRSYSGLGKRRIVDTRVTGHATVHTAEFFQVAAAIRPELDTLGLPVVMLNADGQAIADE